ncbi:MAG: acetyl-CoA C-acetyltransferase, partial [Silicimonas sp.]|nr:acetyl-CoA C-acetyltransferase [Silicimonas sp.]
MDATDQPIFICGAARTPLGAFQGAFSGVSATELGSNAIRAALADAGLQPEAVGEVLMGNVLPAGLGQAPARQAAIGAG